MCISRFTDEKGLIQDVLKSGLTNFQGTNRNGGLISMYHNFNIWVKIELLKLFEVI